MARFILPRKVVAFCGHAGGYSVDTLGSILFCYFESSKLLDSVLVAGSVVFLFADARQSRAGIVPRSNLLHQGVRAWKIT
mmetsp:Transcript_16777/g.41935  ORF Transcript_16777/g.41935 Transcript_16777/m.41935 type:complete len:80 (+) Transcript_16777:396-635(+)